MGAQAQQVALEQIGHLSHRNSNDLDRPIPVRCIVISTWSAIDILVLLLILILILILNYQVVSALAVVVSAPA